MPSVSMSLQLQAIVVLLPTNHTVSQDHAVELDASLSFDPSDVRGVTPFFAWTCLPLTGPPPCRTLAGDVLVLANASLVVVRRTHLLRDGAQIPALTLGPVTAFDVKERIGDGHNVIVV